MSHFPGQPAPAPAMTQLGRTAPSTETWAQRTSLYTLVVNPNCHPETRLNVLIALLKDFNFPDFFNMVLPVMELTERRKFEKALEIKENCEGERFNIVKAEFEEKTQVLAYRRAMILKVRGALVAMQKRLQRQVNAIQKDGYWLKEEYPELHEDDPSMEDFESLQDFLVYPEAPAETSAGHFQKQ